MKTNKTTKLLEVKLSDAHLNPIDIIKNVSGRISRHHGLEPNPYAVESTSETPSPVGYTISNSSKNKEVLPYNLEGSARQIVHISESLPKRTGPHNGTHDRHNIYGFFSVKKI